MTQQTLAASISHMPSHASKIELVLADNALDSLRASGHDFSSAVGEVFDNSIQANANTIRLKLFTEKRAIGQNTKKSEVVDRLVVGDDGDGMPSEVLHKCLQLGYSSRYNDRTGMGRFGVGAKLAGISQAQRIEVYSRQSADQPWLYTYIDLEEIRLGEQRYIPAPVEAELPEDCVHLVGKEHGTLVVWSKTDRLAERDSGGARQASTVESELMNYTARVFRKFLDGGIQIHINERKVLPHDPLFLMTTTRFHHQPHNDPVATVLVDEKNGSFDWEIPGRPGHHGRVEVRMTLLPEAFRRQRGAGRDQAAKDRRIDENEGISILRAGREIFYGYLRGVQPPIDAIDRWWAAEITFSPELDECFQVRNVKKGAEPIDGLRDKLNLLLYNTAVSARKQIQSVWDATEADRRREAGVHGEAQDVATKTKDTSPKPRAGQDVPEEDREQKIHEAAVLLTADHPEQLPKVEQEIRERPVTIVPQSWPGNELFEIDHLGTTALVKLNMRHPFYREVYGKLLSELEKSSETQPAGNDRSLARLVQVGLDLLIISYARAEGMRTDATQHYSDLRTYWSVHLKNLLQEWKKTHN